MHTRFLHIRQTVCTLVNDIGTLLFLQPFSINYRRPAVRDALQKIGHEIAVLVVAELRRLAGVHIDQKDLVGPA